MGKYTMEQISAFSDAGRANRVDEMLDLSVAVRAAGADEKVWKKYVGSISRITGEEIERKEVKVISKEQAGMLRALLAGKMRVN